MPKLRRADAVDSGVTQLAVLPMDDGGAAADYAFGRGFVRKPRQRRRPRLGRSAFDEETPGMSPRIRRTGVAAVAVPALKAACRGKASAFL
jgi:hypothetical protein